MAEITINLANIQNIKTINIEGVGVLRIRRMGSGEDLDLSVKRRRINHLIDDLNDIDFTGLDVKKPSQLKKIKKLSQRAEALSEEIADIKHAEFEVYKRLLSDDVGGKVVDVVMNTLTDKERAELFLIAFGEKEYVKAPETLTPAEKKEDSSEAN